jgi:hypothetical protein
MRATASPTQHSYLPYILNKLKMNKKLYGIDIMSLIPSPPLGGEG